ncbi:hypothetical protein [Candidatus Ornithobacterium hominis]|uniref:hypothetical protein n=1 Tax=Candidatus Ornithobacterium hominis TaxID=2497989 RepID=UPI0014022FBF|nr:hypothetical protein [Candidatus Ornithobacterium hominis]
MNILFLHCLTQLILLQRHVADSHHVDLVFQRWILRWEKLNVLFVWLDFVVTKLVSIE